jgi:hypothetical protein
VSLCIVLDSLIRTRLDTLAERSRIYAERCRSSPIRPNFYGNDYNYTQSNKGDRSPDIAELWERAKQIDKPSRRDGSRNSPWAAHSH